MIAITNQNFGVEIELTGITRKQGAEIIAKYFCTLDTHGIGHEYSYDAYLAMDRKGRTWKCAKDSSIRTEARTGRRLGSQYACELVTPILQYEDLEDLQQIVREFRHAGAIANDSCGIHVHVDGANHNSDSLQRLINFAVGRQDLFYEALNIGARADRWCKKTGSALLREMKNDEIKTKSSTERIWYSEVNDGYMGGIDHRHYNQTRYHGINLHAFFTKGTVEFRLFNGTTHAGEIKSYVQFCLAMSAWAINCDHNNLFFKGISDYTQNQKYNLMKRVLRNRLGMKGEEFKTAVHHLTKVFAENRSETAS